MCNTFLPVPTVCSSGVTRISVTFGVTPLCTWLQRMVTWTASPSSSRSAPMCGVWITNTTPRWTPPPSVGTWPLCATWILWPPSRAPSTPNWCGSWRSAPSTMPNSGQSATQSYSTRTSGAWRSSSWRRRWSLELRSPRASPGTGAVWDTKSHNSALWSPASPTHR